MIEQENLKKYSIIDPSYVEKYDYPNKWSVQAKKEHTKDCHELWRGICNMVADLQILDEVHVGQPSFNRPMHISIEATKAGKIKLEQHAPHLQICMAKWLEPHRPRALRR